MTSPVYTFSVPAFISGLTALANILKKGESYATENGIPPADFINARLSDDMKPLSFQIQSATDLADKGVARATHTEPLGLPQTETTFAELYARIEKVLDKLKTTDAAAYAGKENIKFKVPLGPQEMEFTAESYINNFALNNFYFHVTTTYAILRSRGVPLGKLDFLSPFLS